MKTLSDQIAAADQFLRVARFHLDNPRPERLDQVTREMREALGAPRLPMKDAA